jgi:hypothetical protein
MRVYFLKSTDVANLWRYHLDYIPYHVLHVDTFSLENLTCLSWSSHGDDERSIVNSCTRDVHLLQLNYPNSVLFKCALVTMVWIVCG